MFLLIVVIVALFAVIFTQGFCLIDVRNEADCLNLEKDWLQRRNEQTEKNRNAIIEHLHEEQANARAAWQLNAELKKRNAALNRDLNRALHDLSRSLDENQHLRNEIKDIAQNAQKRDENGRFVKTEK